MALPALVLQDGHSAQYHDGALQLPQLPIMDGEVSSEPEGSLSTSSINGLTLETRSGVWKKIGQTATVYEWRQADPADVWIVDLPFVAHLPMVQVFDDNRNEVDAAVTQPLDTRIVVRLTAPHTGWVSVGLGASAPAVPASSVASSHLPHDWIEYSDELNWSGARNSRGYQSPRGVDLTIVPSGEQSFATQNEGDWETLPLSESDSFQAYYWRQTHIANGGDAHIYHEQRTTPEFGSSFLYTRSYHHNNLGSGVAMYTKSTVDSSASCIGLTESTFPFVTPPQVLPPLIYVTRVENELRLVARLSYNPADPDVVIAVNGGNPYLDGEPSAPDRLKCLKFNATGQAIKYVDTDQMIAEAIAQQANLPLWKIGPSTFCKTYYFTAPVDANANWNYVVDTVDYSSYASINCFGTAYDSQYADAPFFLVTNGKGLSVISQNYTTDQGKMVLYGALPAETSANNPAVLCVILQEKT